MERLDSVLGEALPSTTIVDTAPRPGHGGGGGGGDEAAGTDRWRWHWRRRHAATTAPNTHDDEGWHQHLHGDDRGGAYPQAIIDAT
jgi:hypothetical protein